MLEIEQKYRITDPAAFQSIMQATAAQLIGTQFESDRYFNAPDRDFRITDEVLRLRRIGADFILTYKGPKKSGPVKTREEIEFPLAPGDGESADRLIRALGFRESVTVEKRRTTYRMARDGFELHICLDALDGIGDFVEIEIVAGEHELERAQSVIQALATELELSQPESRAYLRLVLIAKGLET